MCQEMRAIVGLGRVASRAQLAKILAPHAKLCTCSGMVRIYKEYDLALHSKEHVQKRVVSSSYPGELSSDDGAATMLTLYRLFAAPGFSI